jgi:hypothetical protein
MSQPLVSIIMGSDSDLPIMRQAADVLSDLGIEFELTIVSAHVGHFVPRPLPINIGIGLVTVTSPEDSGRSRVTGSAVASDCYWIVNNIAAV